MSRLKIDGNGMNETGKSSPTAAANGIAAIVNAGSSKTIGGRSVDRHAVKAHDGFLDRLHEFDERMAGTVPSVHYGRAGFRKRAVFGHHVRNLQTSCVVIHSGKRFA
jgi:hypothetical protein